MACRKTKQMEHNKGVKLLGYWVSPFVQRVKWALEIKGVSYEYLEDDIFNKSPLLLKLNPIHKKVPVLVHDEKVLSESLIILEYIDETWKETPSLLPQDPYERAMARFWARFAEEKVLEAAFGATCSRGDEQEKAVKSTMEALEKIEQELKGKKFFGGETIGYLDIVIGWIAYLLPIWEKVGSVKILDPSKFPAIGEWIQNFLNHPIVKDDLPAKDKAVAYFEARSKYRTRLDWLSSKALFLTAFDK